MSSRNINVVIVGGSTAGLRAAKTIASLSTQGYTNLSITIIDKNEYYFHAIGAPRSIVDAEFGKKLFVPLKDIVDGMQASSSQSKHQFIHSTLTSINDNHTITLSNGQTLVYDYLVLATGARNRTPAHYDGTTVAEAQSNVIKVYENIKKAHDILIIGGGAVGVEMAGEIAGAYPDKKITLVHSAERLLPLNFKDGLSNGAVDKLGRLGVKVVLNERIDLPTGIALDCSIRNITLRGSSGTEYQSDLQIPAIGTTLYTDYISTLEARLNNVPLRDSHGAIKVKSTLQLDAEGFENVFVPGDVNSLPAGAKYAVKAAEQGVFVGNNIVLLIKAAYHDDKSREKAKVVQEYKGGVMNMILVPIGKSLGVFQAMGLAFGKSFVGDFMSSKMKAKDYFLTRTLGELLTKH